MIAQRHHWLNTIVGILDGAFYLTDEEEYAIAGIVGRLLTVLNIPDRGLPEQLPMPVVQEVAAGFYTNSLTSVKSRRGIRGIGAGDCNAPASAWRAALENMLTQAYPDMTGEERLLSAKVFSDILAAIGVPKRAAAFFPDAVIAAYRDIEDATE